MMRRIPRRIIAFTLVELIVTIGIIAILVAIALPALSTAMLHADCAVCCVRMRSLGMAFHNYASDHNDQLPGRVTGAGNEKWPLLLLPYVEDQRCYADPGDPVASSMPTTNLVSNAQNNSSFFFNGFNDLGFYTNPNATVGIVNLNNMSSLFLLGQQIHGSHQYYMDFVEGNEDDILNKTAYFNGANYVYADGSAAFVTLANYNNRQWLVNQAYNIPVVPGH